MKITAETRTVWCGLGLLILADGKPVMDPTPDDIDPKYPLQEFCIMDPEGEDNSQGYCLQLLRALGDVGAIEFTETAEVTQYFPR